MSYKFSMSYIRQAIIIFSLMLSACATAPQDDTSAIQISSEQDTSRAISSLLAKVDIEEGSARWEHAAALLERALRIKPRNAELWHRLAQVRYQQGQYHLARSLAQKSNALAGDKPELQIKNARLLEQVRTLSGEAPL